MAIPFYIKLKRMSCMLACLLEISYVGVPSINVPPFLVSFVSAGSMPSMSPVPAVHSFADDVS